ncbi:MAG TPA: DUF6152 family protein [Steroidobacteraceae bacterium]|nr:DUF6152 family protein [Steroidobacteraceae bacterium]
MKTVVALVAGLAMSVCASAHHSNSAYDKSKQLIVTGTVKEFRWANPHVWLYVMVPNAQNGTDLWSLEGGSVSVLARNGWRASSIKSGDHVRVMVQPNRDGSNGGGFVSVTMDDGKVFTIGVI